MFRLFTRLIPITLLLHSPILLAQSGEKYVDPYGGVEQFFKDKDESSKQNSSTNTERTTKSESSSTDTAPTESDARIRVVESANKTGRFLESICESDVEITRLKDGTRSVPTCEECPKESSRPDGDMKLHKVYVGDYTRDDKTHAVLAATGCGAGFNFRNSTVVVEKTDNGWKRIDFIDGLNSKNCSIHRASEWAFLVCKQQESGRGVSTTNVSVRRISGGGLKQHDFLELFDKTGACQFDGSFLKELNRKEVRDLDDDEAPEIALELLTRAGEAKSGSSSDDPCDRGAFDITTRKSIEVWEVKENQVKRDREAEELKEDQIFTSVNSKAD